MKRNSILSINDIERKSNLDDINLIWLAIMQMNTYALNQLLDDTIDYEDIGKFNFIEKLGNTFNQYRTLGDSELLMDLDHCKGCVCDQPVCKFIGNISGKHFALYFEIKENEIVDIYHCNWYGKEPLNDLPF